MASVSPTDSSRAPSVRQTAQVLPGGLPRAFLRELERRERTVWDARRLLAHRVHDIIEIRYYDGVNVEHRSKRWAEYRDVLHSPNTGFQLKLRGLLPAHSRRLRHQKQYRQRRTEITVLPIKMLEELPEGFEFLDRPTDEWPMPPVFAACSADGCGYPGNTGRFCVRCGRMVRRGSGARFLGEGFAAMQLALRKGQKQGAPVEVHGCGARVLVGHDRFCPKCGEDLKDGSADGGTP